MSFSFFYRARSADAPVQHYIVLNLMRYVNSELPFSLNVGMMVMKTRYIEKGYTTLSSNGLTTIGTRREMRKFMRGHNRQYRKGQ